MRLWSAESSDRRQSELVGSNHCKFSNNLENIDLNRLKLFEKEKNLLFTVFFSFFLTLYKFNPHLFQIISLSNRI